MDEQTLQLFKTLTEFPAAPGFEREIRSFVKQRIIQTTDEIVEDRLGSIFGVLKGDERGPRVMVAGHLDEVGFMVLSITDNGMIRFQPLGGWSNQVLPAQRVQVITDEGALDGVIASTPPHLLKGNQQNETASIENMFIDIGADDREDAERLGVRPGQQIVPVCPLLRLPTRRRSWLKRGTIVTVSVWRCSCWKK